MEEIGSLSAPAGKKGSGKLLTTLLLLGLIGLAVALDMQRREAEEQLRNLSVQLEQLQTGDVQQNREVANQIIGDVRKLFAIPDDVEPTVAAIIDVDTLRQRNPFYARAENGYYLVVTSERAILYDPVERIIIDVIPVQVQSAAPPTGDVVGED